MPYDLVFADALPATVATPYRVTNMPTLLRAMEIVLDQDLARPRLEDMAGRVCRRLDLPAPPSASAPGYRAYREEWLRVTAASRSKRSPNAARVPAFKFQSNEDWHVVPEECEIIADHLEVYATDGVSEALRRAFAAFNRQAVAHGGYLVR
ncbi:MAG: hypothetical protein R3F59_23215 [Myxococcota bacterium]